MSGTVAAIADHLWQSTLFALAAALMVGLVLRRNRANERYWLWLAASLKFLLPFSLLVSVGNHLAFALDYEQQQHGWQIAVNRLSQPFSPDGANSVPSNPTQLLGVVLLLVWACGFLTVVTVWLWRWQAIARTIHQGIPLEHGPEAQILRQMQQTLGVRKPITLLQCPSSLEPGVVGIFRPVLLWPEGISAHFSPSHLQAVIAHEVSHVRRRDNLAAMLHMLVEAVFWFHPLVWWLGARLMRERERACDESVLELGSERSIYAESILKTCQFCISSPLPLLSGVTGAQLKQRIVDIMTGDATHRLGSSRKLVLSTAAACAFVAPMVLGVCSVYGCQGVDYKPAQQAAMCDLLDGRQKPFAGELADLRNCRTMADELISVPELPNSMTLGQQGGEM
jgi:bla regulator protein blaR1